MPTLPEKYQSTQTPPQGQLVKTPADLSKFYVITPISNVARFKRRYALYWKFHTMLQRAGIKLITVELALGDRPFMVTERNNPMHVQVRSVEEFWHKENLINIGLNYLGQLDPEAREMAWVDADCFPMTMDAREWFNETWHALQHYEFVQMWEWLINFGPQGQPLGNPQLSFMATYQRMGFQVPPDRNLKIHEGNSGTISLGRPGLAWAANIKALNQVGGLIDFCILGSGDWHMAHGLVGAMDQGRYTYETQRLSSYTKKLLDWQEKCERWIKRDVGFVPGTVGHEFHGNKKDRQYGSRGRILIDNLYDPNTDLKYDHQGLIQLETWEPRQIKLRDQIRHYFKTRNEDSVDAEV